MSLSSLFSYLHTGMVVVRHILFYGIVGLWTLLFMPFVVVVLFLPRRFALHLGTLFCYGIKACIKVFLGITHRVTGVEHLPQGGYILASKHQSTWETLVFMTIVRHPTFVLKQELMRLPIIGTFLRKVDMIPVSRSPISRTSASRGFVTGGSADANSLTQAASPTDNPTASPTAASPTDNPDPFLQRAYDITHIQHRPIIIFPEGTRTAPGQVMRYRQGVVRLAQHLGLPVVPVALNSGVFWPRRRFLKTPGIIDMVFLPPLDPCMPREILAQRLKNDIETASSALL